MSRGYYRGDTAAMLRDAQRLASLGKGTVQLDDAQLTGGDSHPPALPETLIQSPRDQGYTGNQCTNCNSMRMLVAGHCEVCADCGTTTGCS